MNCSSTISDGVDVTIRTGVPVPTRETHGGHNLGPLSRGDAETGGGLPQLLDKPLPLLLCLGCEGLPDVLEKLKHFNKDLQTFYSR